MNIPFWRNVSAVLLAAEAFVLALIPLVAFYLAGKGVLRLRFFLRPLFLRIRARVQQVERITVWLGELVVAPIIAIYVLAARVWGIALAIAVLPRGGTHR